MSEPMIKIENVSKWYGPVQVLSAKDRKSVV